MITIQSETLATQPEQVIVSSWYLPGPATGIFQRRPSTSLPPGIARLSAPEYLPAHAVRRSENGRKVFQRRDRRGRCEYDCRHDRRRLSLLPDTARWVLWWWVCVSGGSIFWLVKDRT